MIDLALDYNVEGNLEQCQVARLSNRDAVEWR
jgi:hypothetical protein